MEIYRVEDLSFTYPKQDSRALENVSFTVKEGEFITLCGPSGCGKSTLLRQLKTALAPHGEKSGKILFKGCLLDEVDLRTQSGGIGFVLQSPENQIVTDKVWHELAFGLESLGCDTPTIRRRVAEMASFFGIQTWFYRDVSELSGGQKQLLNLASIMVMNPSVLILDEPTSQLDPIASSEFLTTVGRINRELGTTVIMTEHRLEDVLPLSSRLLAMENGRIILDGAPEEVGESLRRCQSSMFLAMPTPMRLYAALNGEGGCPVNVRDGRDWISRYAQSHIISDIERKEKTAPPISDTAVELDEVWFRYERQGHDIVKGLSIKANRGEFLALLGGNGTGKTTTLTLISGINRPYRGNIKLFGRDITDIKNTELFEGLIGVLPQNPQALFVRSTVFEDLLEILPDTLDRTEREKRAYAAAKLCNIEKLLGRHPYDLSGGEQQRAALAKVLLLRPKVLLLDEPTKGLDSDFKRIFAAIIKKLTDGGVTVIMVSHDVEFCASYAHRCALFFDGGIVAEGAPDVFFSGNSFYTTAANRMVRHLIPSAVIEEDVIKAFGGRINKDDIDIDFDGGSDEYFKLAATKAEKKKKAALPLWRKALGCVFGALILLSFIFIIRIGDYKSMFELKNMGIYAVLLLSMLGLALSVAKKTEKSGQLTKAIRQKLPRRTVAALLMIIIAVPLTIFAGVNFFGGRKYYIISLLVIIETILPFLLVFESRKPQARELIIISVLCAIGVAGRTAFYMVPYVSPVLAVVIISGVAFGGEVGFLVGAMTAFVSNFFFGQGPWTPWQMFGMGIIGFIAGILFRKGLIRPGRLPLCVYGGFATVIIYGGLLNPASVIMYYNTISWDMIFAAYVTGLPVDLVHGASTVVFLWLTSRPMLEKLDRIKTKYGLYDTDSQRKPEKCDKALISC
jgi:energy-coupling factor transport system ATP-binding protein